MYYLGIIERKKIVNAFEVIKSLPTEFIAILAAPVLSVAYTLKPGEAVEWAKDQLLKTVDPRIIFGFCQTLHAYGVDLHAAPGFIERVRELFSQPPNRLFPGLYELVRRYEIPGASAVIANDLRLTLGPQARQLDILALQMYESLAALPDSAGHQSLLEHVRVCPPNHRLRILEYLVRYRPELVRPELPYHLNDAEPTVREGVESLIAQLSGAANTAEG